jgi:hypothetical protein
MTCSWQSLLTISPGAYPNFSRQAPCEMLFGEKMSLVVRSTSRMPGCFSRLTPAGVLRSLLLFELESESATELATELSSSHDASLSMDRSESARAFAGRADSGTTSSKPLAPRCSSSLSPPPPPAFRWPLGITRPASMRAPVLDDTVSVVPGVGFTT